LPKSGVDIPINVETLVEAIYVSPGCAPWFVDAVRSTAKSNGYSFEVRHSELDDPPLL
jgi:predicted nicotinamide N-methyase